MKQRILENENLPVYGLGLFMFVAGASKFFMLDSWLGYEPRLLVEIIPLTARQLTLAGGGFEALLGLLLFTRKKALWVTSATALWLGAITLQVARLGIWDIAIRDFGLTVFGSLVAYRIYQDCK